MIELPGLTWEYIAMNIDLYRLAHLNCQWASRPGQIDSLISIEHMISSYLGFKSKEKIKKIGKPKPGDMELLDFSKFKVIGEISR